MFSEKLDIIMKLTDTQASALGAACHLNPSYVSRLRTGKRPLPKKPSFLRGMSGYLARRIRTEEQRKALCGVMNIKEFPEDIETLSAIMGEWLTGDEKRGGTDISPLIKSFTSSLPVSPMDKEYVSDLTGMKSFYYGVEGKRQAVLHFFDLVLREKKPRTLMLFSDEDMDWLCGDDEFSEMWMNMFIKVIGRGNRVKVIHSTGRRMNEMIEAVAKWIPIYKTGMVEPYYYPKLRDGIFRRTLFIAPETAAVVSSSVENSTQGMLNALLTDKDAVAALGREYESYWTLCRPLMQILTPSDSQGIWKAFDILIGTDGNVISMSDMPTIATMPLWVAQSMQERAPEGCILERHKALSGFIGSLSEKCMSYTEILPEEFDESKAPELAAGELYGAGGLRYTEEEWAAHLESTARFHEKNSGYLQVRRNNIPRDMNLIVKEGRGVIMTKNISPCIAFGVSETNMVNSFYDYLLKYTLT